MRHKTTVSIHKGLAKVPTLPRPISVLKALFCPCILFSHTRHTQPDHAIMADQPQMPKATHFRFFDLPGELRNRIYDFAVVQPKPIEPCKPERDRDVKWNNLASLIEYRYLRVLPPSICSASSVLRKESLKIYYAKNKFVLPAVAEDEVETGDRWIKAIGVESVQFMTSIVVLGPILLYDNPGAQHTIIGVHARITQSHKMMFKVMVAKDSRLTKDSADCLDDTLARCASAAALEFSALKGEALMLTWRNLRHTVPLLDAR